MQELLISLLVGLGVATGGYFYINHRIKKVVDFLEDTQMQVKQDRIMVEEIRNKAEYARLDIIDRLVEAKQARSQAENCMASCKVLLEQCKQAADQANESSAGMHSTINTLLTPKEDEQEVF